MSEEQRQALHELRNPTVGIDNESDDEDQAESTEKRSGDMGNIHEYQDRLWCCECLGQSLTKLPDGTFVQIAGGHEDGFHFDYTK